MEPWGYQDILAAKLGPDVVIEETTIQDLVDHMNQKTYQRSVSKLLLDQGFFGIGNYLRSGSCLLRLTSR